MAEDEPREPIDTVPADPRPKWRQPERWIWPSLLATVVTNGVLMARDSEPVNWNYQDWDYSGLTHVDRLKETADWLLA
jgi:hypothetical protein